jgi:hypothetical protein
MALALEGATVMLSSADEDELPDSRHLSGVIAPMRHRITPQQRPRLQSTQRPDECQEVGIDHVRIRRAHAMRKTWVDLQLGVLDQPSRQQPGVSDRNDLILSS